MLEYTVARLHMTPQFRQRDIFTTVNATLCSLQLLNERKDLCNTVFSNNKLSKIYLDMFTMKNAEQMNACTMHTVSNNWEKYSQ